MLASLNAFRLAMAGYGPAFGYQSAIFGLHMVWLWVGYGLAIGLLWADYGLVMGQLWAGN